APAEREDQKEILEDNIAAYGLHVPYGWRAIVRKEQEMKLPRILVETEEANTRSQSVMLAG
ncbi:MAG TPA: hypothetical protein VJO72_08565, partial [Candidatus Dormibacteraeota bacterium]|nr:hypothetical protein [Candidatus Dormibacteraeota bacterium]